LDKDEKIKNFFNEEHTFKNEVVLLRQLALKCKLSETFKWSFPTYTFQNKNIIAICKFKSHFGIWFFNGVFLSDPKKVLENSQEGKTKAMRHWRFKSLAEINNTEVCAYILEAIENQKKGLQISISKKPKEIIIIPPHLSLEFKQNESLENAFQKLTYSEQKEYTEYINSAKQEKTKLTRLNKIVPLILNGYGLNDLYRK
tara:strand:+ start:80645 stop:81244 length:600 start_codon:yes stop_codon:yes gene_type:complete